MTEAPVLQPATAVSIGVKLATLVMGGGGPPWALIAIVVGFAGCVGGLGFAALEGGERAFTQMGAATARLADLRAAETARDQLQQRLAAVEAETEAQIAQMQTEHDARVAAAERAARLGGPSPKPVATCDIALPRARAIKGVDK